MNLLELRKARKEAFKKVQDCPTDTPENRLKQRKLNDDYWKIVNEYQALQTSETMDWMDSLK